MKQRLRTRFRFLATVQVLLIAVTALALSAIVLRTTHVALPVLLGAVGTMQVLGLLRFVERHVENLEEFFAAVHYEDLARHFVADDVDAELKSSFNRILERFRETRAQRDLQANYLETVVRHVPVPLLAARQDGTLTFANHPAQQLTGVAPLGRLDDLAALDPALPDLMHRIPAGGRRLLQTRLRGIPAELRVSVAEIRANGDLQRLYAVENLSGELNDRESAAWRNLIRVLTHEIMNTLTPVTSLAKTCATMLDDPEAAADVREAVEAIARRSEGLMHFVAHYRELLRVPQPRPESLRVRHLLEGVVQLVSQDCDVSFEVNVTPNSLELHADPQLLDQVLINIVKNAVEALDRQRNGLVRLIARLHYGRVLIEVTDNGPGIPASVVEQIFVPFFTTKREGSGIGLSVSRQIMSVHGGQIAVVNAEGGGTRVTLAF